MLQIVRPVNLLIGLACIYGTAYIINPHQSVIKLILSGLGMAFAAAAGYIINDLVDLPADKINHPERPLVTGLLHPNEAVTIYKVFLVLSFSPVIHFGAGFLLIMAFVNGILYWYSFRLKATVLAGNITIALLSGFSFIYAGIIAGSVIRTLIPALFAFLVTFLRELVKDSEDMQGDLQLGVITFPGRYGLGFTRVLLTFAGSLLIILTYVPLVTTLLHPAFSLYATIIINPLLILVLVMFNRSGLSNPILHKVSMLLKIIMVTGLAGLLWAL
ncbi:MAG: geranylgeranylglycerol-phosphate geranylgeranyltransferase [Ignavibacteria bacterium]|nr:geranylgeranylglycerol-phosphate geranylgeranyltransferase [Ignavibacteria bacterium]